MPAIMLHPSNASSSSVLHMLDCEPGKPSTAHLYVCQPHTIQIIQLVEATPPPRRISSVIHSHSARTSSASSCPTSDSDSDCSSYCSSIVTPDESSHDREPIPWTDDTYSTRMTRVHAWRDGFVKATACALPDTRTSSLKRKTTHQADDDTVSHCSKRSRSRDGHSINRLTGHPCPACDALFPSRTSLRKHGRAADIPEACRVAVEYNFE